MPSDRDEEQIECGIQPEAAVVAAVQQIAADACGARPEEQAADPTVLLTRFRDLADVVAAAAAEAQLALSIRDGVVLAAAIWQDGVHPLDKSRERHVQHLWWRPGALPSALAVVAELSRRAGEAGCHVFRVTASTDSDALRGLAEDIGLANHYFVTRKVLRAPQADEQPTEATLTTDADERSFALRCLAAGVVNGLDRSDPVGVAEFVEKSLEWDQAERFSYVLRSDGELVAHAYVVRGSGSTATLFDLFVPAEYQGRGYAKTLGRHVEFDIHGRGALFLEGTVVTGLRPPGPALLASLLADGWWLDRVVLRGNPLAAAT